MSPFIIMDSSELRLVASLVSVAIFLKALNSLVNQLVNPNSSNQLEQPMLSGEHQATAAVPQVDLESQTGGLNGSPPDRSSILDRFNLRHRTCLAFQVDFRSVWNRVNNIATVSAKVCYDVTRDIVVSVVGSMTDPTNLEIFGA